MLGIVVPAHNEETHLPGCLRALRDASRHPALQGEAVQIAIVLDSCSDRSRDIVAAQPVISLCVAERNVGRARAAGARHLIGLGVRWLAFTDADTIVSSSWLSDQLALRADAVCGVVSVADWSEHPDDVRDRYDAAYRDADDHRHVHGANFGVATAAYLAAGGFPPLALSEDVALVQALQAQGSSIAWSCQPRVTTSARRTGRARGGFADHLMTLHRNAMQPAQVSA